MLISNLTNVDIPKIIKCYEHLMWFANFGLPLTPKQSDPLQSFGLFLVFILNNLRPYPFQALQHYNLPMYSSPNKLT